MLWFTHETLASGWGHRWASIAMIPDAGPSDIAARRPAPASASLLEAAIERGGLHPFFQARVAMGTRAIVGAEALARIASPNAGLASPAGYIELAERSQRIDALTLAMARAVAGHAGTFGELPCSINLSPLSLANIPFADALAAAITNTGLPCSRFTLEITDTRQADYSPTAFETMTALRAHGFGLALDDFGAGASNIDRLRNYPFTEVKIDPAFIRLAMDEAFAKAALVSCVRLARDHGLKVVAEGVETQEMWDFMTWLKVDEAQGFLLHRPMQPTDFRALLGR